MPQPPDGTPQDSAAHKEPADLAAIFRRLGPAGPLAAIAAIMPAIGGFLLLGFINRLGPWLQSHGEAGVAIYVAGFAILSGFALLPTYALAILGGWAFGFAVGFPAAMAGFLGGALIAYVIARRAAGDRVVRLIDEHPKWKAVYEALVTGNYWRTLLIVTLLRLPPNSPFAMTNLVLTATRVPLSIYVIATSVGMAPRTGLAVFLAARLENLSDDTPGRWPMIIVSIVLTIVIFVVIGHFANKAIAQVTGVSDATAEKQTSTPDSGDASGT